MKPNWFDKTIGFFAPMTAAKRARARLINERIQVIARGYDGASAGRRTLGWKAGSTSANSENGPALVNLRNRARDLVRNEAYASKAVRTITSNIIGEGIMPKAVAKSQGRARTFNTLWKDWGESLSCDFDGRLNFYGMQMLAMREVVEAGEVLIRRRRPDSSSGIAVPLQLQILEADFLDTTRNGEILPNGNMIIQGVEFTPKGRRVAYWLYNQHPGENYFLSKSTLTSDRVPAEEILHLYDVLRAGQVRGVSWFAPGMLKLRDLSDMSDATLLRQKLSACFTAFVTDTESMPDLNIATDSPPLGEKLEPGIIEVLGPGKQVTFANPPGAVEFGPFAKEQLRAVAASLGVSYEALTGDYSQVNFSSGRMGHIEFQRNIGAWQWQLVIPHLCIPTWRWFAEAAAVVTNGGGEKVSAEWTCPRREMISPTEETSAAVTAVRSGFKSLSEVLREQGYDPETVLGEIAEDNKLLDKLGLVLDTDPRKTMKTGIAQPEFSAINPSASNSGAGNGA